MLLSTPISDWQYLSGNQLVVINRSLFADVQVQNTIKNLAFGFGHPVVQEQVLAPGGHHCFHSEDGMIG
jgi:hypothetical protein